MTMKVQEIMSTKVETIKPTSSLRATARTLSDLNIGALPVVDDGKLVGIITDRDVSVHAIAIGREPQSTDVETVMSKEVFTCYENQSLAEAAHIMEEHNIRRLAVLDSNENVVGILTVDDIARVSHELAGGVLEAAVAFH
jgi:CBS domain-containing protein